MAENSVKTVQVDLPAEIFDVQTNVPLIHQVVVAQLAAARQGTHKTKRRGEVSGAGRKPFKQKGTGRARQGSIRAPHMTGGGVVHGPTPRDSYLKRRPLAVIEARADHCRRYVRQLEIRGPGELTVKHDKWLVQPGTVRGIREVLAGFDAPAHDFKRASNYAPESASSERQKQQKSATALKEA